MTQLLKDSLHRGSARRGLLWLAVVAAAFGTLLYFYVYGDVPGPDDLRAGAQPASHVAANPLPTPPAPAPAQPAPEVTPAISAAPAPGAAPVAAASPAPEAAAAAPSPPAASNRFTGVWQVRWSQPGANASEAT